MADTSKAYEVVLSLENALLGTDKLRETPSMAQGLNRDVEFDLRIVGCEYIQTGGALLKLPQVAMATAQVLFQRFYYCKSFINHDFEHVAMACIVLAAKIEECPRRLRDVINVFHALKQKHYGKPLQPMDFWGPLYTSTKNNVIRAERRLLKNLGFCVHVKHPHKIIITYLQILEHEQNTKLSQRAWNCMNDLLMSDVFVRFTPETIACACIFLAARELQIPLPENPPWWRLFDTEFSDIEEICCTIIELYGRKKRPLDELLEAVHRLKKPEDAAKTGKLTAENGPNEGGHKSPLPSKPLSLASSSKEASLLAPVKRDQQSSKPSSKATSPSESKRKYAVDSSRQNSESSGNESGHGSRRSSPRVRDSRQRRSRRDDEGRYHSRRRSRSRSRSRERRPKTEKYRERERESQRGRNREYDHHGRHGKTGHRDEDRHRSRSKYR